MVKHGGLSIVKKLSNMEKGKCRLNSFIKQMQKNKSDSNESDTETEMIIDGNEGTEIVKIIAILTRIFDELKDLMN